MITKTLPGLSKYLFREDGMIISLHHNCQRLLRGGIDKDGYHKYVLIGDMGERRYVRRASLICAAFHGSRPYNMGVRHLDGTRDNDAASNLTWSTQAENCHDKIAHGTAQQGERQAKAKLKEFDVIRIRADKQTSTKELALIYGVNYNTIYAIRSGRNWRYLL